MDVEALAGRFRAEVERTGLLLVHDAELPSATALAAGGPFAGSWWSHPLAHPIYDALQLIEDDVTRAKLVKGKVTLVARRLWPALVAVGASRAPWQLDALPSGAVELLAKVDGSTEPLRAPAGAAKVVVQLERRLLVHSDQVHTASGRHAKVLQSWSAWAVEEQLAWTDIAPEDGVAVLATAAEGWPPTRARVFPW